MFAFHQRLGEACKTVFFLLSLSRTQSCRSPCVAGVVVVVVVKMLVIVKQNERSS